MSPTETHTCSHTCACTYMHTHVCAHIHTGMSVWPVHCDGKKEKGRLTQTGVKGHSEVLSASGLPDR